MNEPNGTVCVFRYQVAQGQTGGLLSITLFDLNKHLFIVTAHLTPVKPPLLWTDEVKNG